MRRDLFSDTPAPRAPDAKRADGPAQSERPRGAPVAHRCAVCGGFAPFGEGLPHRGERVVYYCREHKPQ
jgi:hypothetical protein